MVTLRRRVFRALDFFFLPFLAALSFGSCA